MTDPIPIIVCDGEDPYDNEAQARAVIRAHDERVAMGKSDLMQVLCFTREEALEIKEYIARERPDITISVSWMSSERRTTPHVDPAKTTKE